MDYEILEIKKNKEYFNLIIIFNKDKKEDVEDLKIKRNSIFIKYKNGMKNSIKLSLKNKIFEIFLINKLDFLKYKLEAEAFILKN